MQNSYSVSEASGAASSLLKRIADSQPGLRPSEGRVAQLVLDDPARMLHLSIAEASQLAGVSQPTVARFSAALGFSGFREFKLRLAQSMAAGVPYVHHDVRPQDTTSQIVSKVFDRAIGSLVDVRNQLDPAMVSRVIETLAHARRIECFGLGNSAIIAQDAHLKLLRFGIPCGAYADSHSMAIAAAVLEADDVVLVFSASGRSIDAIECARAARARGAKIVAVTASGTPLADAATMTLAADVPEDPDTYAPMTSRLAQLAIVDTLCVGIALALGAEGIERLERVKQAVRKRRL